MSKFCRNCGKELSDDAVFCGGCGTDLSAVNTSSNCEVQPQIASHADGSDGTIVFYPQPLDDEMGKYHKVIWTIIVVQWVALSIFLFSNGGFIWGIGLGLAIRRLETKKYYNLTARLRRKKFKFISGISNEQLFNDMSGIFMSKYNYSVEKNKKGKAVVFDGNLYFEISAEEDSTFTIWYSMPVKKALLSVNDYGDYKKIIAGMGIIAYEIQNRYNVAQSIQNA